MNLIISTNYEILMGFLESNFNNEQEFLILTTSEIVPFYLKKMKYMNLYNIRVIDIVGIKDINDNELYDILFILDIDIDNYLYYIRYLTNMIDMIAVYKYVSVDENNNIKQDKIIDTNTKILELKSHNFLKRFCYKFIEKKNNMNIYINDRIATPFF